MRMVVASLIQNFDQTSKSSRSKRRQIYNFCLVFYGPGLFVFAPIFIRPEEQQHIHRILWKKEMRQEYSYSVVFV